MGRMTNLTIPKTVTVTVTVAGTPVQGSTQAIPDGVKITVRAHPDNTGRVYVANSSANALAASGANCPLDANQAQDFHLKNLNMLWCDAAVSGEKVLLTFEL